MDKVLSARVDETVIRQIGLLARELKTTKKAIIESAIRLYSEQSGLKKKSTYLKPPAAAGIVLSPLRKQCIRPDPPSGDQWSDTSYEGLY